MKCGPIQTARPSSSNRRYLDGTAASDPRSETGTQFLPAEPAALEEFLAAEPGEAFSRLGEGSPARAADRHPHGLDHHRGPGGRVHPAHDRAVPSASRRSVEMRKTGIPVFVACLALSAGAFAQETQFGPDFLPEGRPGR